MKEALLTTCSRLLVTETREENILTHRKETALLSSPIPLKLPPLDPSSHSHIHGVRGRGDPSPGKGSSLLLSPSPKLLWFPTMSVDSAWVPLFTGDLGLYHILHNTTMSPCHPQK